MEARLMLSLLCPIALVTAIGAPVKAIIPYDEARPVIDAFRQQLPAELRGAQTADLEAAWRDWALRHDAAIRARLQRGDEDSIVNLWLYGTTFTARPRVTEQDTGGLDRERLEDLLLDRLDDLVDAIVSPGANEHLRFARQVMKRGGINPAADDGKEQARVYLVKLRERMLAENARYRKTVRSAAPDADADAQLGAYATMFRDRGLSSDTSINVDFAVDEALDALRARGSLVAGHVRRVAIIGPGLDFTDKAEGYDFYPPQTIQPFAVFDSLIRLGLAAPADLRIMTFDLSPRINQHLTEAIQRARSGRSYIVHLPLSTNDPEHQWHPDLVSYWRRFGDRIGQEVKSVAPPAGARSVRMRAVRVRPSIVMSIVPMDLNIVVERLNAQEMTDRFDLVVATNVLVYYDAFEQALALTNVSAMLRPGGIFLTNYVVHPRSPMESSASVVTSVFWDRQRNGDTLFSYTRH
jgi:SAM-dependent methyltransferase